MTGTPSTHGLHGDLVGADWAPLALEEADQLLRGFPEATAAQDIRWLSPRPFSSAAIVETPFGGFLVKRHSPQVRTVAQLREEHAYLDHLRRSGGRVVRVLADAQGNTALEMGEWVWEVHELAVGLDLYRDDASWTPYRSTAHAYAAGAALADWHEASEGYSGPVRDTDLLVSDLRIFGARDPLHAMDMHLADRPTLFAYLKDRNWRDDLTRHHLPWHRRLAPYLDDLRPSWTHGDWHPSNLFWSAPGHEARVTTVVDVGLSDRTTAILDIATAIERAAIPWLDLVDGSALEVDRDVVDALLAGYASVRQLSAPELLALPELLPLAQCGFALSEADYFLSVLSSPERADDAWTGFFVAHTAWFDTDSGQGLIDHLRRMARRFA